MNPTGEKTPISTPRAIECDSHIGDIAARIEIKQRRPVKHVWPILFNGNWRSKRDVKNTVVGIESNDSDIVYDADG